MNKFDPKYIPYIAGLTTAVMLTRAAVDHFELWGWVIGPLAGLVVSFSLATAGSKISDIAAKRKPLAYLSLFFLVAVSPVVIALSDPTPDAATWAWAMVPDASILLTSAVTGKSLLAKDAPQVAPQATQVAGKKPGKKKKLASKGVPEADFLAFLASNPKASQQVIATHFGISRSAVGQRIAALKKAGKIKP